MRGSHAIGSRRSEDRREWRASASASAHLAWPFGHHRDMTSLRTLAVVASATIIDDGPDGRTYELRLVVPSTSVGVQRIVYVPTRATTCATST